MVLLPRSASPCPIIQGPDVSVPFPPLCSRKIRMWTLVLTWISLKGVFSSWEGAKKHNTARTILSPWSWSAQKKKELWKVQSLRQCPKIEKVRVHCRDRLSWKEAWSQIYGIGKWTQPISQSISISFSYKSCGTQAEYELIQIKAKPLSINDQIFSLA